MDLEADGLKPENIWVVCLQNLKTEQELTFYKKEDFNAWLDKHPEEIFIGHNIISFDIPCLNRLWDTRIDVVGRSVDTLVLSYLYNAALEGGHSLESYGLRLKYPKGDFDDWSKLTPEMVKYCQQDVRLAKKVYQALCDKMLRIGFSELSCSIEHKIRVLLDEQQKNGFYFDRARAEDFRTDLRRRQSDIAESIHKLFPPDDTLVKECPFRRNKDGSLPTRIEKARNKYHRVVVDEQQGVYRCYDLVPFNLGSPKQRVQKLLSLGWVPEKFTKTKTEEFPQGFPQVDEDALVAFAKISGRQEVQALSEWLVLQGRASMLDTWFNNLGSDSRIHGKVITCGASTRRMTHSSPNTANIPSAHKAKYGKECRSFWTVEPNKGLVLVGYDASGLETAGLCHYLNNSSATDILLRPKPDDIHTANSRRLSEALGWECDREWAAKTSWYAWLYGAYEPKLGSIVGASKHGMSEKKAGEIVVNTFFRNVPGLKELIDDVQGEWNASAGLLRTIDGGYVRCHSLNAALNYKIQSAGAIVMKLTSILLDEEAKKLGIPFKKCADIHDEAQLEVEERYAEELGKLAVYSITKAGVQLGFKVPLTGDFKVGNSWDETH